MSKNNLTIQASSAAGDFAGQCFKLREQLRCAVKALEIYGNKNLWEFEKLRGDAYPHTVSWLGNPYQGWKISQEALEKIKAMEKVG